MVAQSSNGTLRAYVERMRALTKSVTARNARIHSRSTDMPHAKAASSDRKRRTRA